MLFFWLALVGSVLVPVGAYVLAVVVPKVRYNDVKEPHRVVSGWELCPCAPAVTVIASIVVAAGALLFVTGVTCTCLLISAHRHRRRLRQSGP